jgi:hypothetical protein
MRRYTGSATRRGVITGIAVALALVAALPAAASARSPRPTAVQATPVAQRLAEQAAEGVRSLGIFEVEDISVWCGRPFGSGARSMTCAYALFVRNTEDGTRQTCVNSVHVALASRAGPLSGRFGSQNCF